MRTPLFYSWQSDTVPQFTKDLIHDALAVAARAIAADTTTPHRPEVDHDTRGVPGAPAIVAAILQKIDQCAVFIADLTLTHLRDTGSARRSPNPNVLLELGYALRRLGPERVLLVLDVVLGGPEQLPFDLRGSRVVHFSSQVAANDRDAAVQELATALEQELRLILGTVGVPADLAPRLTIGMQFTEVRIESARHDYRLNVELINGGPDVIANWSLEVRFPKELLDPAKSYPTVGSPSPDGMVSMRRTEAEHSGALFPGDKRIVLVIDYIMVDALYDQRKTLFAKEVVASAFVSNILAAKLHKNVKDLQNY